MSAAPTDPIGEWLDRAQKDLEFAKLGLDHGYFRHVCFLSQQAAEKSLKALLIADTGTYPRTHGLPDLAALAVAAGRNLAALDAGLRVLDQFYTPARYPDVAAGSGPTRVEADEALKIAQDVVTQIGAWLGR